MSTAPFDFLFASIEIYSVPLSDCDNQNWAKRKKIELRFLAAQRFGPNLLFVLQIFGFMKCSIWRRQKNLSNSENFMSTIRSNDSKISSIWYAKIYLTWFSIIFIQNPNSIPFKFCFDSSDDEYYCVSKTYGNLIRSHLNLRGGERESEKLHFCEGKIS